MRRLREADILAADMKPSAAVAANPQRHWTASEFLAFVANSEFKHELIDGDVYDAANGTAEQSQTAASIIFSLMSQLVPTMQRFKTSDMMLSVSDDRYLFPAISVVCGNPKYEDESGLALASLHPPG